MAHTQATQLQLKLILSISSIQGFLVILIQIKNIYEISWVIVCRYYGRTLRA